MRVTERLNGGARSGNLGINVIGEAIGVHRFEKDVLEVWVKAAKNRDVHFSWPGRTRWGNPGGCGARNPAHCGFGKAQFPDGVPPSLPTKKEKKEAERNRKDFKEKTFQAQARKAGRDAERLKRSGFVARTGYVWQDAVVVGVSLAVCIGAGTYVNRKMEQRARERHHQEYSMTTTTTSSTTSSTPETK